MTEDERVIKSVRLEVKRLVKELNMSLKAEDFKSIYQECEAIMGTIDEAELDDT